MKFIQLILLLGLLAFPIFLFAGLCAKGYAEKGYPIFASILFLCFADTIVVKIYVKWILVLADKILNEF